MHVSELRLLFVVTPVTREGKDIGLAGGKFSGGEGEVLSHMSMSVCIYA